MEANSEERDGEAIWHVLNGDEGKDWREGDLDGKD